MTTVDLTRGSKSWTNNKFDFRTPTKTTILLDSGNYFLECWGSKGSDSAIYSGMISKGGRGGYSSGVYSVSKRSTIFVFVGGIGSSSTTVSGVGGFNGGGACGQYAGGGGGSTDFRLDDSHSSRLIVAGGGGGANGASPQKPGSSGGGMNGIPGIQRGSYGVSCYGSQTGCDGGIDSSDSSVPRIPGSIGTGGGSTNYHYSGGGGGYYGGGSAYAGSGGGGSGFIGKVHQYQTFKNITRSGEEEFLSPQGNSETGHDSSGYARITFIDISIITRSHKHHFLSHFILIACILANS